MLSTGIVRESYTEMIYLIIMFVYLYISMLLFRNSGVTNLTGMRM